MSVSGKDLWDKIEIAGKVALPVVLLLGGYFLNSQFNQRQRANELIGIAIGILSAHPLEEPSETEEAIRNWAIEILRDPTGHHTLSDEIAEKLKETPISFFAPSGRTTVLAGHRNLPPFSVVHLGFDEDGIPIRGLVGPDGEVIPWSNREALLPSPRGPRTPSEEIPNFPIIPLDDIP